MAPTIRAALLAAACVCPLLACGLDNEGEAPPRGQTNFPSALSLSPTADADTPPAHLLVVSANFDLRYNRGSLQAFDLAHVSDEIDRCLPICVGGGDPVVETGCELEEKADCAYGPDGVMEIDPLVALAGEVLIDAFGTGIALSQPDAQGATRVYVPIRSQLFLTQIEYDPGAGDEVLSCGGSGRDCASTFDRGAESVVNGRDLTFPGEPVGVVAGRLSQWADDVSRDGDFVLIAHRRGEVSLYIEDEDGLPALTDTLGTLPTGLTGIMFDESARMAYVTGSAKSLSRVGLAIDEDVATTRVFDGGELSLDGITAVGDLRAGIVAPGTDPEAPSSALLIGRLPSAYMEAPLGLDARTATSRRVRRTVEVGAGPTRIAAATLNDGDVELPLVAVSCFDGREVHLIDRRDGRTLSVVPNLSGPFELAIDGPRKRLYVADFRSSVVRIVDLAPLLSIDTGAFDAPTGARIVATLGRPRVVEELQ